MGKQPAFAIGDAIWLASCDLEQGWINCPDCGGTGRIRCLTHDDTLISFPCPGCDRPIDNPRGRKAIYLRKPKAQAVTVTGVETWEGDFRYHTTGSYACEPADLFTDEAAALARAEVKAAEDTQAQIDRINQKERDGHSWAWNATYHRREIRDLQKRIEYHTAKLAVAAVKAKEPAP